VTLKNDKPLPEFIRYSSTEPSISVATLSAEDEGEYTVVVKATINDMYRSTKEISFNLQAIYDPQDYSTLENTAPFF